MRYERERRETEHRHGRTVEQLENRVASLDVQNKDLTEVRQMQSCGKYCFYLFWFAGEVQT